jgi:hypothetical protein
LRCDWRGLFAARTSKGKEKELAPTPAQGREEGGVGEGAMVASTETQWSLDDGGTKRKKRREEEKERREEKESKGNPIEWRGT